MKSLLKYVLWSLFGLVATVSTVLAYVALAFDPNAYKPQIIQTVQDATHRTLKLDGDIKLMLFPSIGAQLGKISISEHDSTREFASVDDASVSLAVWPLLRQQMVINQVNVRGVKVSLTKYKDGTTNLDDIIGSSTTTDGGASRANDSSVVAFDVAGVQIEDCLLQYEDHGAGSSISVSQLNLKTGRLANDVITPVDFSAHIQSKSPNIDAVVHLVTSMSVDLERQKFTLKGMELNAAGGLLDISDFLLKLAGEATADLGGESYELNLFVLNASGRKSGEKFDVQLTVPGIKLERGDITGANLEFKGSLDGPVGMANASLSLPSFRGNSDKFNLPGLIVQAGLVQAQQSFNGRVEAELIGSLKSGQFNFKDVSVAMKAGGESLPGKVIESTLKGSVQADLERQSVHAKFAGGLMQSQLKAEVALRNFNVPSIRYDIELDKLDLDAYFPAKTSDDSSSVAENEETVFDLSALKALNVTGSVRIGALKTASVQLEKLRVDLKAKDGLLEVEPFSAALYQGRTNGSIHIDANTSAFEVRQKFSDIEIAPLLKDAAGLEPAEGRGTVTLAVTTQGNSITAVKQALNGNVSVQLDNGAIRGIDLAKLIQGVQNLSKDSKAETLGINKDEKTPFSEFKASFKIRDGVAHNDDLSVKSTVLRLGGNGYVDVGRNKMDYNAKVILAKTELGRTGTLPVRVFGPFDNMQIRVDYAELVADIARQRLNEERAALKQKLDAKKAAARAAAKAKAEEKLKQGLKGLFK